MYRYTMNNRYNFLDWFSLALVIVGAINWGLVGFFNWNVVDAVFGAGAIVSRIIYALVGLSGLYMIATGVKMGTEEENAYRRSRRERTV